MNKLNKLESRLTTLESSLPPEYFQNNSVNFISEKHERQSIYNLETNIGYLKKVVIVQSCARRWLARIKVYKIKKGIKDDPKLNNLVTKMMRLKNCNTLTALAILNKKPSSFTKILNK